MMSLLKRQMQLKILFLILCITPLISLATPLIVAIQNNDTKLALLLIKKGANVNKPDENGNFTPLSYAVGFGNEQIVMALLKAGAEPDALDINGDTPLDDAIRRKHKSIVKILESFSNKKQKNGGSSPLFPKSSIISPNNFYRVSSQVVEIIEVIKPLNKDDYYEIRTYMIRAIKKFKKLYAYGDLIKGGWWSPKTQQFYTQLWKVHTRAQHCNQWGKSNWSYSYIPTKINVSGREIKVWKESSNVPENRKPDSFCINEKYNVNTCKRISCNQWRQPKPGSYIVESKDDAIEMFIKLVATDYPL